MKVLATRRDERVVGRERRRRDGVRPAEVVLRVDRVVCHFADDAEVVQGIGEVRMLAERLLLKGRRLAHKLLGGGVVARRGRLFGVFDDRLGFGRFRPPESDSLEREQ